MEKKSLIFTYGTLKSGFSNHPLMQDLIHSGDATFLGVHRTCKPYPLVCGPFRVPFLLNLPERGQHVHGELYAVSPRGLARMDELEGTTNGHYERLPVVVNLVDGDGVEDDGEVEAEAYYGHRSYAEELWRRSGKRGFGVYSEKEARGYVKRTDRPKGVAFLDHIRSFVGNCSSSASASVALVS